MEYNSLRCIWSSWNFVIFELEVLMTNARLNDGPFHYEKNTVKICVLLEIKQPLNYISIGN